MKKTFKLNRKYILLLVGVFLIVPAIVLALHEGSVRYYQDKTCVVCHEMRAPIKKWKESGTAKKHSNCAGCHFDNNISGWWKMNVSAVRLFFEHFTRDSEMPLEPRPEPMFLEEGKEPGYWSHVPNHRCFQCHDAKNHNPLDQQRIHSKLVGDILSQACKDCHNHEMRNGQKFYDQLLPGQDPSQI